MRTNTRSHQWAVFFCFTLCLSFWLVLVTPYEAPDGPAAYNLAEQLFQAADFDEAAAEYWKAVIWHDQTPPANRYDVQNAFQQFLQCYMIQGKLADGMAFVALESFRRGQTQMGETYLQQALQIDPNNKDALFVKQEFIDKGQIVADSRRSSETVPSTGQEALFSQTPEELYDIASDHFTNKRFEDCADIFEISCAKSGYTLGPSCANAVYCRSYILDWGFNGTRFQQDMKRIEDITQRETKQYRVETPDGKFAWKRATSVHPHMMLGYPVDPLLKRYVTESVAFLDEHMARAGMSIDGKTLPGLPNDLPFLHSYHSYMQEANSSEMYKIKVGFVGSGFSSKAVLFLSHDMFRFFDGNKFEIHVFSFGSPDSDYFIKYGMDGVDWRARVQSNVEYFHDMRSFKDSHFDAARFIRGKGIHILVEWDGYARQGESYRVFRSWRDRYTVSANPS